MALAFKTRGRVGFFILWSALLRGEAPSAYHYAVLERDETCRVFSSAERKLNAQMQLVGQKLSAASHLVRQRRERLEKCGAAQDVPVGFRKNEESLAAQCETEYREWMRTGTEQLSLETDQNEMEQELKRLGQLVRIHCPSS